MRYYIILMSLIHFLYPSYSQIKPIDSSDLDGLVKCINLCELFLDNQEKLDSLFDDPILSNKHFRTSFSETNYFSLIKKMNSRFTDKKRKIDHIEYSNVRLPNSKVEINSEFKIRYKSLTTNKIIIFIFNDSEDQKWELFGIQYCINFHEQIPDIDKPCIDE